MRTTQGNKQVPQISFRNSPYSRKYVLIRLTLHHWQPCILQFYDITKDVPQINTGSLGLQVTVAVAKFSNIVIGYSVPIAASWLSRFLVCENFWKNKLLVMSQNCEMQGCQRYGRQSQAD